MIVKVALDVPVRMLFDYRCGEAEPPLGSRVLVQFRKKECLGIVIDRAESSSLPAESLLTVTEVLTDLPPLGEELLAFLRKAEAHTQQPIGKLTFAALPPTARKKTAAKKDDKETAGKAGAEKNPTADTNGDGDTITATGKKVLAEIITQLDKGHGIHLFSGLPNTGKISIITKAIAACVDHSKTSLVLAPSIYEIDKLEKKLAQLLPNSSICKYHSEMTPAQQLSVWRQILSGSCQVLVGTRSAVFAPLCNIGLICVLDENDPHHRAASGLIYSARDLAAIRGRCAGCPVLMSAAVPSVELRHAARTGKLRFTALPKPDADARPKVQIIDISARRLFGGISTEMENALRQALTQRQLAMVLVNRRGRGGMLYCTSCRHVPSCPNQNCRNSKLAVDSEGCCICRQCGYTRKTPDDCMACGSKEIDHFRAGSSRIFETLSNRLPEARILRADADKNPATLAAELADGNYDIIVGTNLLTSLRLKPGTVVVADADSVLHGPGYRAAELLLDSITKLTRLAGNVNLVIQTRFAKHHLFESLRRGSYETFAHGELAERQEAGLPPFRRLALLTASGAEPGEVAAFIGGAKFFASELRQRRISILEPVAASNGASGKTHMQLLLSAHNRANLQDMLQQWLPQIEAHKVGKGITWNLEIDPESW